MLYTAVVLQLKLFAARWHFNLATFLNSSPAQVLCTKLANLRQLSQYIRHNYYFSKKHNRYNMKLDPGYYLLFFFPVQLKPTKLWDKGDNEISRYFWRRKWYIVEIIAKYFVDTFTSSAANRSIGSTTGCTITEKAPTRAFSWLKAARYYRFHI